MKIILDYPRISFDVVTTLCNQTNIITPKVGRESRLNGGTRNSNFKESLWSANPTELHDIDSLVFWETFMAFLLNKRWGSPRDLVVKRFNQTSIVGSRSHIQDVIHPDVARRFFWAATICLEEPTGAFVHAHCIAQMTKLEKSARLAHPSHLNLTVTRLD